MFAKQIEAPDAPNETLFIDIKFEERFAQDDYNTSQMAILINLDEPAAIRQGDVHMSFDASSKSNLLAVGFFTVLPDSTLSEVGRAIMSIDADVIEQFTWPEVSNVDYKLWLTLKKQRN